MKLKTRKFITNIRVIYDRPLLPANKCLHSSGLPNMLTCVDRRMNCLKILEVPKPELGKLVFQRETFLLSTTTEAT